MSHHLEPIVFELEKHLIRAVRNCGDPAGPPWEEETLAHFPEKYQDELRHPELYGSIGIGHTEKTGWFILGTGQGPFIIWTEKSIK